MRNLLFILFCLLLKPSISSNTDIYSLRKLYYEASDKKDSAKKFLLVMENLEVKANPLLLCYKGMANLIHAKHSYNPYTKFASFNKGKEMLENAVVSDPKNVEIRFMRYCVQSNAPFFLGYSSNLESDKSVIMKGWSALTDLDLKEKIRKYMLTSNSCSTNEKTIFK
ncbi:MAG: hypothetical protein HYX39_09335 [Bacteroidetes bacterium]|nr:hypothetical protein [Bacteroidota bacterium]